MAFGVHHFGFGSNKRSILRCECLYKSLVSLTPLYTIEVRELQEILQLVRSDHVLRVFVPKLLEIFNVLLVFLDLQVFVHLPDLLVRVVKVLQIQDFGISRKLLVSQGFPIGSYVV